MMNYLQPLHITFFLYIVLMIAIGVYAYRATNNLSDYILGGRSLGSFVTAMSAGASDMSGWLLMGLPGAIFLLGLSEAWIAIGLSIGAYLNWLFVAGRLRTFTEFSDNALTLPDYFHNRFDDGAKLLKILSAIVILFFFLIYCASGVVASARLFESTFGMEYHHAVWVGAFATIVYVFVGGFLAVSWTDTVQASLMIFALLVLPVAVIFALGDLGTTLETIAKKDASLLNFVSGVPAIAIISSIAWGLGYCGQPHILVRFMAADSVKTIPKARRISITWMVLCLTGAVAVGFFGIAYFVDNPELGVNVIGDGAGVKGNHEAIFMELTKILFNPWFAGIILSGILAAVMSTLSCQLLVASSALTEDLYKGFLRKDAGDKELVWIGRLMVFLISMIAIGIAHNPDSKVLGLVAYAWAGFGAAFGPLVVTSLFLRNVTRNGALAGMFFGAVTVIIYPLLADIIVNLGWTDLTVEALRNKYAILKLYEIVPGFLLSLFVIIVVSKMSKPTEGMIRIFDEATSLYHQEMKKS